MRGRGRGKGGGRGRGRGSGIGRVDEDGNKRSGALGSDVVALETASEGQDGNGEKVS